MHAYWLSSYFYRKTWNVLDRERGRALGLRGQNFFCHNSFSKGLYTQRFLWNTWWSISVSIFMPLIKSTACLDIPGCLQCPTYSTYFSYDSYIIHIRFHTNNTTTSLPWIQCSICCMSLGVVLCESKYVYHVRRKPVFLSRSVKNVQGYVQCMYHIGCIHNGH